MDVERYTATLSPRQRRIFLALDQYADAATGVLALVSVALQLLIGTPGAVVLAAMALVLPAGLLTYGLNRLCKWLLPKPRRNRRYHDLISPWLRGSFPSFHTQFAATFGAAFSMAVALLAPAGGLAGGLAALGASLVSGFEVVAECIDLAGRIEEADLVIAGEGYLDEESFNGKAVGGVAELAAEAGVPLLIVAGDAAPDLDPPVAVRTLVAEAGRDRAMGDTLAAITDVVAAALEDGPPRRPG